MPVWHYQQNGASKGPFSDDQLKALCDAGAVTAETLVWRSGFTGWKRLADTDFEFKPAAAAVPPPVSSGTAAPAAESAAPGEDLSMWRYFTRCLTSKYATFKGRARRKEFWAFTLFSLVSLIAIGLTGYAIDIAAGTVSADSEEPTAIVTCVLIGIWALGMIIPNIALTIRRVHDLGITGWLAAVCFIPSIGWIATLVIGLIPGQPHANAYGAAPQAA